MTNYSEVLRELAEPRPVGDTIQSAIVRAARVVGIPYARTFNIWYRRARRIDAHEADQINEALRVKREKAAINEYQELRTRLAKLESLLVQKHPNFHR